MQTNMQMDRDVSLADRASLYLINHVQIFTHTTKKTVFDILMYKIYNFNLKLMGLHRITYVVKFEI